ncbi:MAG: peptidoglycan-binding domain-containing protein [Gemmatimonadota bacterium]|nr:peptidoglycan-binding domain-containing protein [Gemmatimonadota bacterium]
MFSHARAPARHPRPWRLWAIGSLVAAATVAPIRSAVAQSVQVLRGGERTSTTAPGIRVTARLDAGVDGSPLYEPLRPLLASEVLALQRALERAGFAPGALDGRLGPRVRSALSRFQETNGLDVCGCVNGETIGALGLRLRVVRRVVAAGSGTVEILAPPRAAFAPEAEGPAATRAGEGAEEPDGGDRVIPVRLPIVGVFPTIPAGPSTSVSTPPPTGGGRVIRRPGRGGLRRVAPPPSPRPPPR